MAPPSPPRAAGRAWALALLAGLMIFAGRSALTFYAGSPVPFHDQWIAEAEQLIVPDAQHVLSWRHFVILHSDHPLVATRLIAYGLYRLTGRWDMLAEMLVNNALLAAAFAFLFRQVRRRTTATGLALTALVAAVWLASPLFYGNALWGFQSSVELLVLTAIVQLVAADALAGCDGWWWLGLAAGLIGAVTFGSGPAASAVAALLCLRRLRLPGAARGPLLAAAGLSLAIVAGGLLAVLRSPSLRQGGGQLTDILHTAAHAFSWPATQPTWFALLLWSPALLATALLFRRRPPFWLPAYALALWAALQVAGIALIRSAPVPALPPRYYDLFAVGVVANGLLAHDFFAAAAGRRGLRAAMLGLVVAWAGWTGLLGWRFARSHTIYDVPVMRGYAQGQTQLIQHYYAGGGPAALEAATFPVRPYPEVGYLDRLLAQPAVRQALPGLLTRPPGDAAPDLLAARWPDHGLHRATWLWLAVALFNASAAAAALLALWREPAEDSVVGRGR